MYTFIANPNARSGRGILLWKQIEKILLEKDLPGCPAEAFYECFIYEISASCHPPGA